MVTQHPWRIHRFLPPGVLPTGVVASHDEASNITLIDKETYEQLTPHQQRRVFVSRSIQTFVE